MTKGRKESYSERLAREGGMVASGKFRDEQALDKRDYIKRTIATVRNHRDADNCWPQWANIFADEIERLWSIEEKYAVATRALQDYAELRQKEEVLRSAPQASQSAPDGWFIPEGDRTCGVIHRLARATCMKRRGQDGPHATPQGTWINGPWCDYAVCRACDGIGAQPGAHTEHVYPCPECDGTGYEAI